jgi:hypothetical protein
MLVIFYIGHTPSVGSVEGGRYIFIINNILKIKYREMNVCNTTLGLKTLRDNKLQF